MKKSRYTEEQIVGLLKPHEAGVKTAYQKTRAMNLDQERYFGVRCLPELGRASFYEQKMLGDEDGFIALVDYVESFDDDTVRGALGVFAELFDGDVDANGVVEEHGFHETEAVVAVTHGAGIDGASGHADGYAEDEGAVGDALAEGLGLAPLGIHVMRVEVTGLAGVEDDVGFSDGAADGLAGVSCCKVFEEGFDGHPMLHSVARNCIFDILLQTYHPDRSCNGAMSS